MTTLFIIPPNCPEPLPMANTGTGLALWLRCGHEPVVLPMVCFMELNDYGAAIDNIDDVESRWANYNIFPMASNIQLVFYRNSSNPAADILVKCPLNEQEVTLPVEAVEGKYYRWADLRHYYQKKLDAFKTRFKE